MPKLLVPQHVRTHLIVYRYNKVKQVSRSFKAVKIYAFSPDIPASVITSCIACSSKLASYLVTYPIESCKIYSQMGKLWSDPCELYQGFRTFMLIAAFQSFLSYNVFFALLDVFSPMYPRHIAYMYASLLSSFLTSFVKVPMTFISRNIIFVKAENSMKAFTQVMSQLTPNLFRKSWVATMLSDVPDSFVKFFVNSYIQIYIPYIDTFKRSCITGVVTSLANAPLDFLVTRTMCQSTDKSVESDTTKGVAQCWSGIHYRMLSCMLGNIVFFNIFNTLTPLTTVV